MRTLLLLFLILICLGGCSAKDWSAASREICWHCAETDLPDRYWFGERPRLLKEYRGEGSV